MLIKSFDNKEIKWNFSKYYNRKKRSHKSSFHTEALEIIKEKYKNCSIYEEVTLPGSKRNGRSLLYADFFIPEHRLIIEIHGSQHYEYSPFFHKSKIDFQKGKARDRDKSDWCELNNIRLIVLPYNEKDQWETYLQ